MKTYLQDNLATAAADGKFRSMNALELQTGAAFAAVSKRTNGHTRTGRRSPAHAPGPVVVCMADVQPRKISWLWHSRIPQGRITLLAGRPGDGKSLLTCDIAARVTTGTPFPDGSGSPPRGSVLFVTGEDDPHDTIRPRLDAHRADVKRVHLLKSVRKPIGDDGKIVDVAFTLADVETLTATLKLIDDCRLVVIDPIGSFLGGRTDAHRDNEVRAVLSPLAAVLERWNVAGLLVAHRRKSSGDTADDVVMGSRAFTGIARAVWHLGRDKDDRNRRLLLPGKNNLAAEQDGLAFTITGDPPALCWEKEPVTMHADDAMADEQDTGTRTQFDAAIEWLREKLADLQEHLVEELKAEADAKGLAWRTVERAKRSLRVIHHQGTFQGKYIWRLPRPGNARHAGERSTNGERGERGERGITV